MAKWGVNMEREYLKDNCNRILGWRMQVGNKVYGYNRNGYPVGHYDTFFKDTKDICGRLIGRGDLLTTLIMAK